MRSCRYRARSHEEQAFEKSMVNRVCERSYECKARPHRSLIGPEDQRGAKPQVDDADVLYAAIREKTLDVPFPQSIQNAQHRGHHPRQKHEIAPPSSGMREEIKTETDEPVNCGLQHHSRH